MPTRDIAQRRCAHDTHQYTAGPGLCLHGDRPVQHRPVCQDRGTYLHLESAPNTLLTYVVSAGTYGDSAQERRETNRHGRPTPRTLDSGIAATMRTRTQHAGCRQAVSARASREIECMDVPVVATQLAELSRRGARVWRAESRRVGGCLPRIHSSQPLTTPQTPTDLAHPILMLARRVARSVYSVRGAHAISAVCACVRCPRTTAPRRPTHAQPCCSHPESAQEDARSASS